MKFYILRGYYSDVYFDDKSKGKWIKIGLIKYLFYYFTGKMVKCVD
jgi:hypothetical protein